MMMIKICGITNAEDALMAADAGANAVGFNFYRQSPRHVDPAQAAEIGAQLPASVLKVGIFVDDEADAVAAIAAEANLDVLQLYGECQATHARIWRARRVDDGFSESSLDDAGAEAFLLDSPAGGLHGGTGHTFDWSAARGLKKRIILAGGLDASNVRTAIQTAQPWGVDACSRLERAPGRKDPLKVREFIKAALNL